MECNHTWPVLFIVVVLDFARTVADGSYTLSLFYALLIETIAVHVHYDVVTDWSYALARFLVSTLFGVSPGQS